MPRTWQRPMGRSHQIPAPILKTRKQQEGKKERMNGEKKQWHSLFHSLFLSKVQMVSVSIEGLCWLSAQLQSIQVESCRAENCQQLLPTPLTCYSHSLSEKCLEGGFFFHSERSYRNIICHSWNAATSGEAYGSNFPSGAGVLSIWGSKVE